MPREVERKGRAWSRAFGRAVRSRRLDMGLSQEGLGFRCDLDRTYVGGVERGERNPTLRVIVRLAEGLEIDVSRLMRQAEAELGPTS